jgi:Ca2+/Na+ antiporter
MTPLGSIEKIASAELTGHIQASPVFFGSRVADVCTWMLEQSGVAEDPNSLSAKLTSPITLTMALTMCNVSAGRVGRAHLAVVATLAPLFALFTVKLLPQVLQSQALAASLAACIFGLWMIIALCVPTQGLDASKSNVLQGLAFVQGIMWMHLCADEIVAVFLAGGRVAGVRESLLGGTVMAWGASAGDLAGMLAVARAGSTRMAITASLAGPICQLAMGTGLSMVLVQMRGSEIQAHLALNMRFLMVFGGMAMSYYTLVVPVVHRFMFTRRTAVAIMAAYGIASFVFIALGLRIKPETLKS